MKTQPDVDGCTVPLILSMFFQENDYSIKSIQDVLMPFSLNLEYTAIFECHLSSDTVLHRRDFL